MHCVDWAKYPSVGRVKVYTAAAEKGLKFALIIEILAKESATWFSAYHEVVT